MNPYSDARFLLSCAAPGQLPPDRGAEVAFAGRSNAGKSTAINAITGRHGLARTSKTPGRTRLLNYFELVPGERIVDLPGYGYAQVGEAERRSWQPMFEALRTRASLRAVFLIVDARRTPGAADLALIDWAGPAVAVHVLLAKSDKLSRAQGLAALRASETQLGSRASVQLFSGLRGAGVDVARARLRGFLQAKKHPGDLAVTGAD